MNRDYLYPSLTIAAGLALMVCSIAWPQLSTPGDNWTDEQAEDYAQAARDYHYAASLPEGEENQLKRDEAKARYDSLRKKLDAARGGSLHLALVLQMLGVGLALIGSVRLILLQNEAEDRRAQRG